MLGIESDPRAPAGGHFSGGFNPDCAARLRRMGHKPMPSASMMHRFAILALLALVTLSGPARAQSPSAPFDGNLQRLAEIMGALHYLRGICGANEGQKWRNEVQALIDAEAPAGDRRARMIAAFNRGYRGFQ